MLRINSLMSFNSVLSVKSAGIQQNNNSDITSLLTINYNFFNFEKQAIDLIFSGNSQISLNIECIDVFLKDISEEPSFVVISIPSPAARFKVSVAEPAVTFA